jgi:hypothetical protein
MDVERVQADDIIAEGKDRLARVDDDGVTFTSHLDGSTHRFTPRCRWASSTRSAPTSSSRSTS